MWSVKAQEIIAGGFTLRFGSHNDEKGTQFLTVTGRNEAHTLLFNQAGDILSVQPVKHPGEPHQENPLAPPAAQEQAARDAKLRADHDAGAKRVEDEQKASAEADAKRKEAERKKSEADAKNKAVDPKPKPDVRYGR